MNMKAILMSIQSKWLAKILNGDKTIEIRKIMPKCKLPIDVYIYCTKAKPYLADFGDYEYPYKSGGIICTYDMKSIIGHDADVFNGKVVGRVWVDKVDTYYVESDMIWLLDNKDNRLATSNKIEQDILKKSCVNLEDFKKYAKPINDKRKRLFAIHFSKLEIFDKPKELGEFSVERYAEMPNGVFPCYEPLTKAPQSWQYVEVEDDNSNETLRKEKQL